MLEVVAIGKRSILVIHPLTRKKSSIPRHCVFAISFKPAARATVQFIPESQRATHRSRQSHWRGNRYGSTRDNGSRTTWQRRKPTNGPRVVVSSALIEKMFGIKV